MLNTARPSLASTAVSPESPDPGDTAETLLWTTEYELLRSDRNVAPRFRMPDLISACVSQLFVHRDAGHRLFAFLGSELILREPSTPRWLESIWRPQFLQLQALQLSAANSARNCALRSGFSSSGPRAIASR